MKGFILLSEQKRPSAMNDVKNKRKTQSNEEIYVTIYKLMHTLSSSCNQKIEKQK